MNNKDIQQLNKLKQIRLDDEVKLSILNNLKNFIADNPVQETFDDQEIATISPYVYQLKWVKAMIRVAVPVAMFLMIATYSQAAVPGQTLYTFKTGINEPLMKITAVTVQKKAAYENNLITERLKEAKKLKAKNLLTVELAQELETKIEAHTSAGLAVLDRDNQNVEALSLESRLAKAEIKGNSNGSIKALMVLSGETLNEEDNNNEFDEETDNSKTQDSQVNLDNDDEVDLSTDQAEDHDSKPKIIPGMLTPVSSSVKSSAVDETKEDLYNQFDAALLESSARVKTLKLKESADNSEISDESLRDYVSDSVKSSQAIVADDGEVPSESKLLEVIEKTTEAEVIIKAVGTSTVDTSKTPTSKTVK